MRRAVAKARVAVAILDAFDTLVSLGVAGGRRDAVETLDAGVGRLVARRLSAIACPVAGEWLTASSSAAPSDAATRTTTAFAGARRTCRRAATRVVRSPRAAAVTSGDCGAASAAPPVPPAPSLDSCRRSHPPRCTVRPHKLGISCRSRPRTIARRDLAQRSSATASNLSFRAHIPNQVASCCTRYQDSPRYSNSVWCTDRNCRSPERTWHRSERRCRTSCRRECPPLHSFWN